MRAVAIGLIASVLALGSAQAAECRLDGAELTAGTKAAWSSDVKRPDLVGRSFHVERVSSAWRKPNVAVITVLVRSGGEAFLVQQISDFSGAPADAVYSTEATDKALRSVSWEKRASDAERSHFTGSFLGISDGPLAWLDLKAQHCT